MKDMVTVTLHGPRLALATVVISQQENKKRIITRAPLDTFELTETDTEPFWNPEDGGREDVKKNKLPPHVAAALWEALDIFTLGGIPGEIEEHHDHVVIVFERKQLDL